MSTDPKALFLGPYSENQLEFRKMVEFLLNDIIQWRRNYHPREKRLIEPVDKEEAQWKETLNTLERELDILLGDMKQSVPFHNPRYLGHMISDLNIPSLLGFLTGQLYNQNNVVGECSPITTEKELYFIKYLCEMFHYPSFEYFSSNSLETHSTGHLTGGGTTANIEALWTARNVKYFPVSLKLLLRRISEKKEWGGIRQAIGDVLVKKATLSTAPLSSLFNLSTSEVLKLYSDLKIAITPYFTKETNKDTIEESMFSAELNRCSVRFLGVYGIHKAIELELNEKLDRPFLIVPQSRHYSWEKAMDIVGLGTGQIKYVKVDESFKIKSDDFHRLTNEINPIIMAVAVAGTTEEGVVDPIAEIVKKKNASSEKGFWLHIDAAYGGYYAALFNNSEGDFVNKENFKKESLVAEWLGNSLDDFKNFRYADSITVDPHKMGYVPYSVGSILYRDNCIKPFIEKKAPYLSSLESLDYDPSKLYLGGCSLEGSRSGAAALACYLSSKVIPNNESGYGQIIKQTFKNAKVFINEMQNYSENQISESNEKKHLFPIQIHPLYDSMTNIVCYAVGVEGINLVPELLNTLNERLYAEMSAEKNKTLNDYKFIVSKTDLDYAESEDTPGYAEQICNFLKKFKINPDKEQLKVKNFKLVLLRSVLMNPLMSDEYRHSIYHEYFNHLRILVNKVFPDLLLEYALKKNDTTRYKTLWIENQERVKVLKNAILSGKDKHVIDISRFLDIDFKPGLDQVLLKNKDDDIYQIFIVDLNLADTNHTEWESGIEVIKKIKACISDPVILVYSQFLNPSFRLKKHQKDLNDSEDQLNYPLIIGNFLKYYMNFADENLIPKSLNNDIIMNEETPVEINDLPLLTYRLSYVLANRVLTN
ncbi:MAG: pyridoxal-dependent decarboxylase [Clostridia bacterium]|nr:pyridoxal-dependent decarboxylase [Clostridia bacterium]